jgi:pilus assembly protein CpaD
MKYLSNKFSAPSVRASGLLMVSALLLAGCSMDGAEIEDTYVAQSARDRFPIKVAEAPVKMNIDARGGGLGSVGVNKVIGFAQDARVNATSRVAVHYASGSAKARNVAQEAVSVLVAQGVPRGMISTGSYRGSSAIVTLSFTRKVAVTRECGDWSQNLTGDQFNEPSPNEGCAIQHNIAAMVANPEDFEGPRPMTPAYGASRSLALKLYNGGELTTASGDSQSGGGSPESSEAGESTAPTN